MNKEELIHSMEYVDERLIQEADAFPAIRKRNARIRWSVLAACLAVVFYSLYMGMGNRKGPDSPVDTETSCANKQQTNEQVDAEYFPEMQYVQGRPYTEEYCFWSDGYISFFDTSLEESTIFCFDPACDHQSRDASVTEESTCLAYSLSPGSTYLTDQHLFFLRNKDWKTYEYIQAEQTGSGQKIIAVIEDVFSPEEIIYQGKYTYMVFMRPEEEEQIGSRHNVLILRVDRDTGEQQILAEECGLDAMISNVSIQGNYLYYEVTYATEQLDYSDFDHLPSGEEIMAVMQMKICRINLEDGTQTVLCERQPALIEWLIGTKYYYCESWIDGESYGSQTKELHILDMETMEEKVDDRFLYVNQVSSCGENLLVETCIGSDEQVCSLLSPEGEILKEIPVGGMIVLAAFEKGVYVVYNGEGGGIVAWIEADAFWDGRFEEQKIVNR